ADLKGVMPPRWAGAADTSWGDDPTNGFRTAGKAGEIDWLRYRNYGRPDNLPGTDALNRDEQIQRIREEVKAGKHGPYLITDFLGYNTYSPRRNGDPPLPNWVADLLLEFQLTVDKAQGEVWVELSKGVDRFRACFQLDSGQCTLSRIDHQGDLSGPMQAQAPKVLDSKPTRVKQPGVYQVRFANVDERL